MVRIAIEKVVLLLGVEFAAIVVHVLNGTCLFRAILVTVSMSLWSAFAAFVVGHVQGCELVDQLRAGCALRA